MALLNKNRAARRLQTAIAFSQTTELLNASSVRDQETTGHGAAGPAGWEKGSLIGVGLSSKGDLPSDQPPPLPLSQLHLPPPLALLQPILNAAPEHHLLLHPHPLRITSLAPQTAPPLPSGPCYSSAGIPSPLSALPVTPASIAALPCASVPTAWDTLPFRNLLGKWLPSPGPHHSSKLASAASPTRKYLLPPLPPQV